MQPIIPEGDATATARLSVRLCLSSAGMIANTTLMPFRTSWRPQLGLGLLFQFAGRTNQVRIPKGMEQILHSKIRGLQRLADRMIDRQDLDDWEQPHLLPAVNVRGESSEWATDEPTD